MVSDSLIQIDPTFEKISRGAAIALETAFSDAHDRPHPSDPLGSAGPQPKNSNMLRLIYSRSTMVFAALTWLVCAGSAQAQAPDYSRAGFYIGGGFSYATDLYEDEIEGALPSGFKVDIDDNFGANARAGFRISSFFALELQYDWIDTYDITATDADVSGQSAIDVQTLTANVKLYLPIQRFHPYMLAGIGYQRYQIETSSSPETVRLKNLDYVFAGRLGLGFDVYLTDHVLFYAEGAAVLSDATVNVPLEGAGEVDNLFYAGLNTGFLWRF